MKRFTTNTTQSIKVIPREIFTNASISITNEFTKEKQTISASGTYFGGFWSTTFDFTAQEKLTYKLIITANGKVQWKGKAFGEQGGSNVLMINGRGLLINNRAIIL